MWTAPGGVRRAAAVAAISALLLGLASARDVRSDAPAPVASAAASAAASERLPALDAAVHAMASARALDGAAIGVAVVDVDSGRLLAAVGEHLALNPASNAKLYTAGAALATLHGEHRYETALVGKLEGDAVAGALAVRGYGDPSLSTADLWSMVQQLESFGVRRVDGDIVVDQRFFDAQTTPPAFDQQPNEWSAFRAPVSAVALDENCVTMTVRPAATSGAPARVQFEPPGFVDVEGTVRTGDAGDADTVELALSGSGSRMAAKVSGTVGGDARVVRYTRRAEDPRLLAGYALKALLEKAGLHVSGDVKLGSANGRVLARHMSAPLSSLLYALGKHSDNFYAEMIFKTLGGEEKGRPARAGESALVVSQWLASIGASEPGIVVKNGSGLFDANRVTAWSTAEVLRWAWRDPSVQPEFVAQLSVGGVDGTLHKRFRGELKRRVRAKTGTLDDVITLSGYVLRDGKGPIAFSILFNHVTGKQDVARHAADRLVETIARQTR